MMWAASSIWACPAGLSFRRHDVPLVDTVVGECLLDEVERHPATTGDRHLIVEVVPLGQPLLRHDVQPWIAAALGAPGHHPHQPVHLGGVLQDDQALAGDTVRILDDNPQAVDAQAVPVPVSDRRELADGLAARTGNAPQPALSGHPPSVDLAVHPLECRRVGYGQGQAARLGEALLPDRRTHRQQVCPLARERGEPAQRRGRGQHVLRGRLVWCRVLWHQHLGKAHPEVLEVGAVPRVQRMLEHQHVVRAGEQAAQLLHAPHQQRRRAQGWGRHPNVAVGPVLLGLEVAYHDERARGRAGQRGLEPARYWVSTICLPPDQYSMTIAPYVAPSPTDTSRYRLPWAMSPRSCMVCRLRYGSQL